MMSPPENEKGTLPGASLADLNLEITDRGIVSQSGAKVKPVSGAGFENGAVVPTTFPPVEKVPLTDEQILLRVIGNACGWSDGHAGKWQAFLVVAGYDTRPSSEIAESLKISQRSFQMHVKAAREWLCDLSNELRGDR